MLAAKKALILREVAEGTGAGISLEEDRNGVQTGIRLWFADIPRSNSPIVTLRPTGLSRFEARLSFGNFASATIAQMKMAEPEAIQLARALVGMVSANADVTVCGSRNMNDWIITDGSFSIVAEKRGIKARFEDDALIETCRELVIPFLAAMAELYGYDPVSEPETADGELEGAVTRAVVKRRERNPRNRLLCLRIHGLRCKVCGIDPCESYGEAGTILEVHHLQPLSLIGEPRIYDPAKDLIPLCPNCHRAAHTRRPVPWTPEELQGKMFVD